MKYSNENSFTHNKIKSLKIKGILKITCILLHTHSLIFSIRFRAGAHRGIHLP
jgi:hypothetical protein